MASDRGASQNPSTTSDTRESAKDEVGKRLLRKIENKPEELTVYTDGSLSHDQGVTANRMPG